MHEDAQWHRSKVGQHFFVEDQNWALWGTAQVQTKKQVLKAAIKEV